METQKPKYLVRPDDFCVFSLNEDEKTYSTYEGKKSFPNNLHNEYSYDILLSYEFYEAKEEDLPRLEEKRKEHTAFTIWQNRSDGHGGVKGGTIEEYKQLNL